MKYKVGDKFTPTKATLKTFTNLDKDSILTISKIENDLIYLNCEIYNYVWAIKDDFNKYFMPFKEDIIEYKGKKYDVIDEYKYIGADKKYDICLKEHKEEILDKKEKEYLENVIKPFRNRITYIKKDKYLSENFAIGIQLDDDVILLPEFNDTRMYKGMELNKKYTLEELGL